MSAAEVLAGLEPLVADVEARLAALATSTPAARPLCASVARDLARHREERAAVARRLRLTIPAAAARPAADGALEPLRAAQDALLIAHADGLPALRDARAVDVLAHHLVDVSRHLTITDLWLKAEQDRG